MSYCLISLREAAAARPVDTLSLSWQAPSPAKDASESGSVSLLQFMRADVNEWMQAESVPSSLSDRLPSQGDSCVVSRWDEECIVALQTVQERIKSSNYQCDVTM